MSVFYSVLSLERVKILLNKRQAKGPGSECVFK